MGKYSPAMEPDGDEFQDRLNEMSVFYQRAVLLLAMEKIKQSRRMAREMSGVRIGVVRTSLRSLGHILRFMALHVKPDWFIRTITQNEDEDLYGRLTLSDWGGGEDHQWEID